MGNLKIISLYLILLGTLSACEVADIPGMFVSDENANQRFEQSREWNARNPFMEIEVLADSYQILSMGDSHVGGTSNLDIFISKASSSQVQAIVMVGDLCSGHAEDYEVLEQHIPIPDSIPSFKIPGNHDLYFDGWTEFYTRFGSSSYLFMINTPNASDLYICLDTGGGTLGKLQLEWFKDILENFRPDFRRCVVYTHNNLFRFRRTASTNPNMEELIVLLELFSSHRVDMVITAHDHIHAAQKFGNTHHIVMDALKDGLDNAGYFELSVVQGELSYEFKTVL